jgi:hypothetical protein
VWALAVAAALPIAVTSAEASTTLYAPARLPTGWVLVRASTAPAIPGNTACTTVEADYAAPSGPDNLTLLEAPDPCAVGIPAGSTPVRVGKHRGYTGFDAQSHTNGLRLYIGHTTIIAYTTLNRSVLLRIFARLKKLPVTGFAGPTSPA